jgi:hypothetical protein
MPGVGAFQERIDLPQLKPLAGIPPLPVAGPWQVPRAWYNGPRDQCPSLHPPPQNTPSARLAYETRQAAAGDAGAWILRRGRKASVTSGGYPPKATYGQTAP